MDKKRLASAATPKALGDYLTRLSKHTAHEHGAGAASIRRAEHGNHVIEIETTYRVRVDGKKVDLPLMVGDDGDVHCHALPNYQLSSALDLVKLLIDVFPESFPGPSKRPSGSKRGGHHGASHAGHHSGGGAGRRTPR
jgi:hypothetical protein